MKIIDVILTPGLTGFYFDDQKAIKAGAGHDGFTYVGEAVTEGFSGIRQKGESISVVLLLENGQFGYGDCAAVQYSGAGGRDPLFLAEEFIPLMQEEIVPRLKDRNLTSFRSLAEEIDRATSKDGKPFHTAIRYGVTQAILDAAAKAKNLSMAEVIAEEYCTELSTEMIPIFCQTGDDRYDNADKAIIKGAQVLPHALINHVSSKLGEKGELLIEYVEWLKNRIMSLGGTEYRPTLHIDVYGTIALAFNDNTSAMAIYLQELEKAAAPLHLRIEGPMDSGNKPLQMMALKALRNELKNIGCSVEIVADEWCNTLEDIIDFVDDGSADMVQIKTPDLGGINNTIEAVLYAKKHGIGAYLGGTCNETNRSAEICVHVALATQPVQMLAKPGMGVDEGYMIVFNEMSRTLGMLQAKKRLSVAAK
jgi:methylaspartate ammonia-lyase